MGGFECERVDMKWLALCTDGSTGCHQGNVSDLLSVHKAARNLQTFDVTAFAGIIG